jgi:predicted O-methyltransferase YrrM
MIVIPNEVIFSILRTLKKANLGDTYYENYMWHYNKRQETFFDIYHFAWSWAIEHKPKKILEIGTRTGLSLCQLLSAYIDTSCIERIVSCDLYDDGFISPELVKYNLRYLGIPETTINQIEFQVGNSKQTIPLLTEREFDYILVDGDHSKEGARIDLENVKTMCTKGGVIVFDDIAPDGMDLLDVWTAFATKYASEFEFYTNMNGKGIGWAIRK